MEKYLNKKELEIFAKHEDNLRRAYKQSWKTYTPRFTDIELGNIYTAVTGKTMNNWSCASCSLKNWAKLGELYFKSIEYAARSKNNGKGKSEISRSSKGNSGKGKGKANVTSGEV